MPFSSPAVLVTAKVVRWSASAAGFNVEVVIVKGAPRMKPPVLVRTAWTAPDESTVDGTEWPST
jgi:hypothetical protein